MEKSEQSSVGVGSNTAGMTARSKWLKKGDSNSGRSRVIEVANL